MAVMIDDLSAAGIEETKERRIRKELKNIDTSFLKDRPARVSEAKKDDPNRRKVARILLSDDNAQQ